MQQEHIEEQFKILRGMFSEGMAAIEVKSSDPAMFYNLAVQLQGIAAGIVELSMGLKHSIEEYDEVKLGEEDGN